MRKIIQIIILANIMFSSAIFANTETENAQLAKVIQILDSVNPIINAAERQKDPNQRIQFCYRSLRRDLEKIKTGITEKFTKQNFEPHRVEPLQGDYLLLKGKKEVK